MPHNVLSFRRTHRRTARPPTGPTLIDKTTVAGQLQRLVMLNPDVVDWLRDVLYRQQGKREVRCVQIGHDLVVEISPPLQMAKADMSTAADNEQRAKSR